MSMSGEWRRPVVLLTAVAGEYTAAAGDVLEVPVPLAEAWAAAGVAAVVEASAADTTSLRPPERAMRPRAKARGAA